MNAFILHLRQNFRMIIILPSLTRQPPILGKTNEANRRRRLMKKTNQTLCSQVKRETHAYYRYFNRQRNRKKKNKKSLISTIKQKYKINYDALQITVQQLLNNIHYEKHTGWVGREFLLCLFVFGFSMCDIYFLFFFYLLFLFV